MFSKKIPILIVLILTIFLLVDFCFAQGDLEVPLPQIGGESAITKTPVLPDYVKYVFNFGIGIAGLIAFLMTVYGGFRYLTSAGNPSAMSDANSQIFAGLIGLIVILSSWLLLTTINPQLIVINPQLKESELVVGEMPGVYLCRDAAGTDCQVFTKSTADIGQLNNKVASVKFSNAEDIRYGVVLHEDKDYEGRCVNCRSGSCQSEIANIGGDGISSITVFLQTNQASGSGVIIYDGEEYQDAKWGHIGPYTSEVIYNNINDAKKDFDSEASSVKIDGTYMVLLFKDKNLNGNCLAISENDPSLSNEGFSNNVKSFQVIFAK